MSDYGTPAGVAAYVKRLADATTGQFTTTTKPPLADVQTWLDGRSARLNTWLIQAGYAIPVTQADAKALLDYYANVGAAGDVELSQISAGYSNDDQNRRENKFLAEFDKAWPFIRDGGFAGLPVPTTGASSPIAGLASGGRTSTGQQLAPIFSRQSFGNDPTRENGRPPREPGYTE